MPGGTTRRSGSGGRATRTSSSCGSAPPICPRCSRSRSTPAAAPTCAARPRASSAGTRPRPPCRWPCTPRMRVPSASQGRASASTGSTRWLVAQAAALHSPASSSSRRRSVRAPRLGWLKWLPHTDEAARAAGAPHRARPSRRAGARGGRPARRGAPRRGVGARRGPQAARGRTSCSSSTRRSRPSARSSPRLLAARRRRRRPCSGSARRAPRPARRVDRDRPARGGLGAAQP